DTRRVVRCSWCGFKTTRIHDSRRLRVRDLAAHGRPTTLVWVRRRFSCGECGERSWEDHPEILVGRRTHVTRRLVRQLVRTAATPSGGRLTLGAGGTSSLHPEVGCGNRARSQQEVTLDPAQHRQSMRRRWSAFLVAIIVLTAVP